MRPSQKISATLLGAGLVVILLYVLAYAFPLHFWGIHFHAYLPLYASLIAIGVPVALSLGIYKTQDGLHKIPSLPTWVISAIVAGGMWLLFYNIIINTTLYGDTRALLIALGPSGTLSTQYDLAGALSPDILSSKNGEQFTYSLVAGLQKMLGCSVWGAFRVLSAALGLVYAFVWMEFTQRRFKTLLMRVLVAAIGLTAGITQVFYAHPEVYAAPILIYTSYLIALIMFLEARERKWLVASAILLLLSIRSHSAGYTLAPTFAYALLALWAGDNPVRKQWLGWKRAGWMIPVACLVLGTVGFLTAFQSGAEKLDIRGTGKNIFLTAFGDGSPDNAYAMFTAWHGWDYFQEFLLCSAPSVAILLAWATGLVRKQSWDATPEIAITMAFILMSSLYFAIDPVLTMPRDWDLCGLIAPPLLLLAVLWLARHESELQKSPLPIAVLMAIGGLQVLTAVVNNDARAVHLHLIDTAKHTFITEHGGGGYFLRHAVDVPAFDKAKRLHLISQAVEDLQPHETAANRSEYAFLCQYTGSLYFAQNDDNNALRYFNASVERFPDEFRLYYDLAVVESHLKQYDAALAHANLSMRLEKKLSAAWKLAFELATTTGKDDLAQEYAQDYLQKFGDTSAFASEIAVWRNDSSRIGEDSLQGSSK